MQFSVFFILYTKAQEILQHQKNSKEKFFPIFVLCFKSCDCGNYNLIVALLFVSGIANLFAFLFFFCIFFFKLSSPTFFHQKTFTLYTVEKLVSKRVRSHSIKSYFKKLWMVFLWQNIIVRTFLSQDALFEGTCKNINWLILIGQNTSTVTSCSLLLKHSTYFVLKLGCLWYFIYLFLKLHYK